MRYLITAFALVLFVVPAFAQFRLRDDFAHNRPPGELSAPWRALSLDWSVAGKARNRLRSSSPCAATERIVPTPRSSANCAASPGELSPRKTDCAGRGS